MSKVLITAVSCVLLCVSSILSVHAATWDGVPASGDWGTDNWGLSGDWPGSASKPAEDAVIGSGNTVTVQAGNTYDSSGSLGVAGNLIVEGTLNYTGFTSWQRGWITVQGNGSVTLGTMPNHDRKQITVKNSAHFEVVDGNVVKTGFIIQDSATVDLNAMQLRAQGIDLLGGTLTSDNGKVRFNSATILVDGGTWNESGTFSSEWVGGNNTSLIDVNSGQANIAGDLKLYDRTRAGAVLIDISGGTLDVDGNVIFSYQDEEDNDDVSFATFTVDGSAGTINVGGITFRDSPDPTPSSKFIFKADSAAPFVSTITVDGAAAPDFSDLVLELADSDAYPGSGDIGVIFAIPGGTPATPFSNAPEGGTLTFVDEGTVIFMQITYAGGDGNDIVVTETVVANNAPVADDTSATTNEDFSVEIVVTATDDDVGDTLTFSEETAPSHGSLSVFTPIDSRSARVTYTPVANYNGPDTFEFNVTDTLESDVGEVSVTINPMPDPPVADAISVTTLEGQAVLIELTGSDPDGDTLTFSTDSTPANGTVIPLDNEYVLYTPNPGYTGPDSFAYRANDGSANSTPATVSITVADPATADDWQTDRWALGSGEPWPGSSTEPTTKATINSPDIVALTDQGGTSSGSVTWTGGGTVVGNTGIAIIGTNGVMNFNEAELGLAVDATSFTTILSGNGIIDYNGKWFKLGGHLRLNDTCQFNNANGGNSFRLKTVTLNGGTYKPDTGVGFSDQRTIWAFNGGSLDVDSGDVVLTEDNKFYFSDGSLSVTGNFRAEDNKDTTARLVVIGTGMGAADADSTGLQVGGDMRVGGDAAAEMETTMAFVFDDTTGVDHWDIGGDLRLNGNGNSILEVDLGGYDTGSGTTGIVLFDYTGNLTGAAAFDTITVVRDGGTLIPGTLGALDLNEYAINYGSGSSDTVKIHANIGQPAAGTLFIIK